MSYQMSRMRPPGFMNLANSTDIRKLLLKVFIGFLSLTALIAIASVLSGKFGDTEVRVLITTFSITAGSICGMSCAAFMEKRKARAVGVTGIVVAALAVVLAVTGIWVHVRDDEYWKTTMTSIVISAAFAHACLVHLVNLPPKQRWMQVASAFLTAVLALQICGAVWGGSG